jgi:hypothetical protein
MYPENGGSGNSLPTTFPNRFKGFLNNLKRHGHGGGAEGGDPPGGEKGRHLPNPPGISVHDIPSQSTMRVNIDHTGENVGSLGIVHGNSRGKHRLSLPRDLSNPGIVKEGALLEDTIFLYNSPIYDGLKHGILPSIFLT